MGIIIVYVNQPSLHWYCITHRAWHMSQASSFFSEHLTGCNWLWQSTWHLYLVAVTVLGCTIYPLDECSMQQKANKTGWQFLHQNYYTEASLYIHIFYCFSYLHKDRPIFQDNFENLILRNSRKLLIHFLIKKLQLKQVKEISMSSNVDYLDHASITHISHLTGLTLRTP